MPVDPRRRQKKLEKRHAVAKAKKKSLARQASLGLAERLRRASAGPIVDSLVAQSLWDNGFGAVVMARQVGLGQVALASFLVDRYCLGVKDAVARIMPLSEYREVLERMKEAGTLEREPPEFVRKIVEQSVEYARGLGFSPPHDYDRAKGIFGSVDATQCDRPIEFGRDGKPLFIQGPEDRDRVAFVLNALERSCGPGGFDYILEETAALNAVFADISGRRIDRALQSVYRSARDRDAIDVESRAPETVFAIPNGPIREEDAQRQ